ncbi:hypothetical protein P170DRAFT_470485 [Aspergillus steynii IBT 23096]|uniref:Uncharacterized protein n=1 Tax=Aspergillus steynii IBT 23096 TaxID=1392250 RepID=A0A2I2GQB2_9EURO|nr:uncharacterized protein P170DRAFT_470485 [Aspergillus steynii IBT 23096]PLB55060.1 hypothetical protein P170DRAFT_470485 [Aspergillus steynii IBT 23096]
MASQCQPHSKRKAFSTARSTFEDSSQCVKEELSESSNDSSIYNAVRASSANDANPSSMDEPNMLDSRMAANIAMLLPLTPEQTAHNPPLQRQDCCQDQDANSCRCQSHLLSDSFFTPESPSSKQTLVDRLRQREVSSLNDMCRRPTTSKWSKDISSPAKPVLPRYPPPVRSPTPPGLPSFGTQEAISYSTQFPVQSFTNDRQPQLHDRLGFNSNSRRRTVQAAGAPSYGERWRRRLGFASTPPSAGSNQQVCAVSRAADGTAVLGRFPHRQSGHGMNAARRLDEHPFHRRTLTMAQCDGVNAEDSMIHEDARSNVGLGNLKRETHIALGADSSTGSQEVQNALPPLPNPAVLRLPRRPISMNTFSNISRNTSYQSCEGQPHTAEASGEALTTGLQIRSRNSDSAGCLLASTQTSMLSSVQQLDVGSEDKPVTWLQQVKTSAFCFSCCLRTGNESDIVTDSNTCSHDTYTTARSQILDESTAEQPQHRFDVSKQSQQFMRRCTDTWKSLCGLASRNFLVTEPMLG